MKNLITILCIIFIISCKKAPVNPVASSVTENTAGLDKGKITIVVESNYQYPYMTASFSSTGEGAWTELKRINQYPNYTKASPYTYSFDANQSGKYSAYVYTCKNSMDTTKYMVDSSPVWHRMKIYLNDTVLLLDTINNSLNSSPYVHMSQTPFQFTIK